MILKAAPLRLSGQNMKPQLGKTALFIWNNDRFNKIFLKVEIEETI
jgi:hypothetical protein